MVQSRRSQLRLKLKLKLKGYLLEPSKVCVASLTSIKEASGEGIAERGLDEIVKVVGARGGRRPLSPECLQTTTGTSCGS